MHEVVDEAGRFTRVPVVESQVTEAVVYVAGDVRIECKGLELFACFTIRVLHRLDEGSLETSERALNPVLALRREAILLIHESLAVF